ncbi:MAG: hypothetical protein WAR01_14720, partial [Dokdonella sp.]|uniref:hypothetical protein n=1 Tax=Dokdonella sp. TaxID=2291710 RepID=UPI003BB1E4CD
MPDQEKVSGNRSADRPKTDGRKLYFHDVAHFEPGSHLFSVALTRLRRSKQLPADHAKRTAPR